MKDNNRHPRRFKHSVRATADFLSRFGFVLFIAIVFLMLTFAVAFGQKSKKQPDPVKEAATKISMGDAYLQQGNGGMAVSSYEDAALLTPSDALPHYKIGLVYLRSKNPDAAMEAFQKAVSTDAKYSQAYKEIAELYYTQKNSAEAVRAQEKYLELTNDDAGQLRFGYYLFMAKDFARANEAFNKAYEKSLLKDSGLRYYGLSLIEAGDYAKGKNIFEEYFSQSEDEVATDYASYGRALVQLKQDSLAAIALEKSVSLDNRQTSVKKMLWETLYSLGKSYYAKKQFELADTTFERLINLHPGVITGYVWAGRANAELDPETEKGLAKDFYEKVIVIGQTTPDKSKNDLKEAYSYLGYYYYMKKNANESKLNWQKVLSIDPQDAHALEALKLIK